MKWIFTNINSPLNCCFCKIINFEHLGCCSHFCAHFLQMRECILKMPFLLFSHEITVLCQKVETVFQKIQTYEYILKSVIMNDIMYFSRHWNVLDVTPFFSQFFRHEPWLHKLQKQRQYDFLLELSLLNMITR